jgi:hypothetical protein
VCRTISIVPPTAPMDASTYAISTRFQPQSEDNHSRHRPDRRQTDRSRGTTAGSRLWCHQGSCRPSRKAPGRPLFVEQNRPRDPRGFSLQRLPARTAHIGGDMLYAGVPPPIEVNDPASLETFTMRPH